MKFCVLRFVDHAHATFTEFFEDFVVGIVLPIMADIYATYIFYFLYNDLNERPKSQNITRLLGRIKPRLSF